MLASGGADETCWIWDVAAGNGAQVLAAIRNVAVPLLQGVEAKSKAAATRRLAAHPEEALPLLFT